MNDSLDTGLRHVRCLEILEADGWRLKLYGMSLGPEPPAQELVERARSLIVATLPSPAINDQRDGVGFATVHAGESGDYLVLDWWHRKDLLKHHLFGAPKGGGELSAADSRGANSRRSNFRYGWPQNVCCCIWEMAVLWFERNAWYRHMLKDSKGDVDGYLAERLAGTV